MDCPKKVTITYYYPGDDKDCVGDYSAAEVKYDKNIVVSLGDEYHDHSRIYIEGFLDASKQIWGDSFPEVKTVSKSSYKY